MKTRTQHRMRRHFEGIPNAIFWPSDLSKILSKHRSAWDAWDVSLKDMTEFLATESIITRAELTSTKYAPIIRYLRGPASPYKLGLSLRRDSYLCHQTALVLHKLTDASENIYVNKEQSQKPEPGALTQVGINLAFKNPQRRSKYQFQYELTRFVLINGKHSSRAGVIRMKHSDGGEIDLTDLERTLIDIVVRPAYAGGLQKVAAAYDAAFQRVDLEHMVKLLRKLNYLYPYAQSIGFLLQRAGRPERDLTHLSRLGGNFDFFLDYGMKEPQFDPIWRVYYPASLQAALALERE
jgi:hypothetical protein